MCSYANYLNGLDNIEFAYNECSIESLNKGTTAHKIRMCPNSDNIITDGGWHFSYLGGIDSIVNKIKSFSHQEYNKAKYLDKTHILCIV
ncbi:MAG: hypothetical protein ACI4S3_08810 [Candidatus Gastranaerophilaceae bacterium]